MNSSPQKILQITGLLSFVLVLGIVGYQVLEGWTFFDSLYMTVITLATVGYAEVRPLTTEGRVFTVFLIFSGMGVLLYGVTELTSFVVEGEMTGYLRRRTMKKKVKKLSRHYILCGWGLKGRHVYEELIKTGRPCVIIENNIQKAERLREQKAMVLEGDATQDAVLMEAGINRAAGLVTTLPSDKDNLFVVITARGLNPDLRIVSKIDDNSAKLKFIRSGADSVVSGNNIVGLRLASEMVRPDAVNFLDSMLRDSSTLRVEDIKVGKESSYLGRTFEECPPIQDSQVLVFSLKHDGAYVFNPSPTTRFESGDALVVIGYPEQITKIRRVLTS